MKISIRWNCFTKRVKRCVLIKTSVCRENPVDKIWRQCYHLFQNLPKRWMFWSRVILKTLTKYFAKTLMKTLAYALLINFDPWKGDVDLRFKIWNMLFTNPITLIIWILILFRMGVQKAPSLYQFPPVTSRNLGISLQNVLILVLTLFPKLCKTSRPYLVAVPNYWTWTNNTFQKRWFLRSNPCKIEVITFLIGNKIFQ